MDEPPPDFGKTIYVKDLHDYVLETTGVSRYGYCWHYADGVNFNCFWSQEGNDDETFAKEGMSERILNILLETSVEQTQALQRFKDEGWTLKENETIYLGGDVWTQLYFTNPPFDMFTPRRSCRNQ